MQSKIYINSIKKMQIVQEVTKAYLELEKEAHEYNNPIIFMEESFHVDWRGEGGEIHESFWNNDLWEEERTMFQFYFHETKQNEIKQKVFDEIEKFLYRQEFRRASNAFANSSNEVWVNNPNMTARIATVCKDRTQAKELAEAISRAVNNGLVLAPFGVQIRYTMKNGRTMTGGKGINPYDILEFLGVLFNNT